jgi:hypothetical protein
MRDILGAGSGIWIPALDKCWTSERIANSECNSKRGSADADALHISYPAVHGTKKGKKGKQVPCR